MPGCVYQSRQSHTLRLRGHGQHPHRWWIASMRQLFVPGGLSPCLLRVRPLIPTRLFMPWYLAYTSPPPLVSYRPLPPVISAYIPPLRHSDSLPKLAGARISIAVLFSRFEMTLGCRRILVLIVRVGRNPNGGVTGRAGRLTDARCMSIHCRHSKILDAARCGRNMECAAVLNACTRGEHQR